MFCSCFYYQWRGHCCHAYAVEIFTGARAELPCPLPTAVEAKVA